MFPFDISSPSSVESLESRIASLSVKFHREQMGMARCMRFRRINHDCDIARKTSRFGEATVQRDFMVISTVDDSIRRRDNRAELTVRNETQ